MCETVVVDLGLSARDRNHLARRFPWCRREPFAFERHPPHARRLAICAWKAIAIDDALRRSGGPLLWLDSATVIHEPLDAVFDRIERDAVLTLAGQSPIRRWCHEATLHGMGAIAEDAAQRCRSAGVLGFDARRPPIRDLVAEWRRWSLIQACIDPPGASRANHRYDQAILSVLLGAFERTHGIVLGDDEVDISSVRPIRWASTRQKVAPWMPLALDPAVRAYYAVWKRADRFVRRARRRALAAVLG